MITANEELLEASLFRALAHKGIADDIAEEIVQMMVNEVLPDIAKQLQGLPFNSLSANDFRMIQLKNAIENGMDWGRISATINSRLRDSMATEAGVTLEQLDAVTPSSINFIVPGPDLLMSLVMEKPFNGKLMTDWFSQLGTTVQDELYQALRVGMVEGKSIPRMAADLLEKNYDAFTTGGVNKAINNAKAVVRTASNMVLNRTREAVYEANSDVISAVEYVATLDDRTTFICMELHGKVFPIGEGERPPQHYQCRSTTVPVLKSWRELGIDRDDKLDGKPPVPESFDEWLKTQPPGVQDKLLGPVRAGMWRDGNVSDISGFVDNAGGTIPLEDFGLNRAGNPIGV